MQNKLLSAKIGGEIPRFIFDGEHEWVTRGRALALAREKAQDLIKEKIEDLRNMTSEHNLLVNQAGKESARRAIQIGAKLLELRDMVNRLGIKWLTWADEHLPFIKKRNRQKYMRLARRKDAHPYLSLGIERLDAICSLTESVEGEDSIGSLFKDKIPLDATTEEVDLSEFKLFVDATVNSEKLQKRGIEVAPPLMRELTKRRTPFDTSLLQNLLDIKDRGEDPEAFLRDLAIKPNKEEAIETPGEPPMDFNILADRLIRTVDYFMENPERISKIDKRKFDKLLRKLLELKSKGAIAVNQEEAVSQIREENLLQ